MDRGRTWLLALLVSAAGASAQYAAGDLVVADQRGTTGNQRLMGITRAGVVYTVTASMPSYAWGLRPAPDNRSLWCSGLGPQGFTTFRVDPAGVITSILVDNGSLFSCIEVDGAGRLILGNANDGSILEHDGTRFTTIRSGPPLSTILGGALDRATGDLIVVDGSISRGNRIFRIARHPAVALTTVMVGIPAVSYTAGLHVDPDGTMIGSWGASAWQQAAIRRLTLGASPSLTTLYLHTAPIHHMAILDRDPWDGQYVVPTTTDTRVSTVLRFDANLRAVTGSYPIPGSFTAMSATVAGSRHLASLDEPRPGRALRLLVSSPLEGGSFYAVALSFSTGPAIPVGGGRSVRLAPDPLFFLSLTNAGIFSRFNGVLAASGEATATLSIPPITALSGVRFFAAAVTYTRTNGVSTISETIGATIR